MNAWKKFSSLIFVSLMVFSCAQREDAVHASLPNPTDDGEDYTLSALTSVSSSELRKTSHLAYVEGYNPRVSQNAACRYWNSLPHYSPETIKHFSGGGQYYQLVSDLALEHGGYIGRGEDKIPNFVEDKIVGRHHPSKLPHLMYFLSHENDDEAVVDLLKKFLLPPNVEETKRLMEENKSGWFQELKEWFAIKSGIGIISGRNEKIVEGLEEKVPGVFTGQALELSGKIVFELLNPFTGLDRFDRRHFEALQVFDDRVPLFNGHTWEERERELRHTLEIMERPDIDRLSLKEKACHYAIYHRIQGQIIKIKGLEGAPVLSEDGQLVPMPTEDNEVYPVRTIPGLFQELDSYGEWKDVVVTAEWIRGISDKITKVREDLETNPNAREDMPIVRVREALNTREAISGLRYLVTLTSFRSNLSFDIDRDNRPDLRPFLLNKYLKMGLAMFGLVLNSMAERELPNLEEMIEDGGRVNLKNDSSDGTLAILLHTLIEAAESFERIKEAPTWVDKELLIDRDAPAEKQEDGLKLYASEGAIVDLIAGFKDLVYLEALARVARDGSTDEELINALERVSAHRVLYGK